MFRFPDIRQKRDRWQRFCIQEDEEGKDMGNKNGL